MYWLVLETQFRHTNRQIDRENTHTGVTEN